MKLMSLVPVEPISNPPIKIVHKYLVPARIDQVDLLIPGNQFEARVKRWIVRKCILSWKHPTIRNCLKSTAAVHKEIGKHINAHPYTIYPFSAFRNGWEIFMIIFMFISLILIPFIIAFQLHHARNWLELLLIINVFFFIDTFLCFFTGYFDPTARVVVLNRKLIIRNYFTTFFVTDLISTIPSHFIFTILFAAREPEWYWTTLCFFKIFRVINLVTYSRRLFQRYQISFQTSKILEMTMILLLSIHWATCLQLYIPLIGSEIDWQTPDRPSWLSSDYMKVRNSTFDTYISCANRAMIAFASSSHFLDMKTTEDVLLNIFLTILGRIGFIYLLTQVYELMTTIHSTKKRNVKLLEQLVDYLRHKELPRHIQQRILTYYTYWCEKSYKRDQLILANVSPILRKELLMHTCASLAQNIEFFKHIPDSLLPEIIMLLKAEIYLANSMIVKAGTVGDALYYIISGSVGVYNKEGDKICHLEDGSYFGEVSLVMENEKQLANVVALETCEVYVLKRSDFMKTLSINLINRLRKLAIEKLEKTNLFDTLYKRDGPIATSINTPTAGPSKED